MPTPTLELIDTESSGKTYINPESAQIIIDIIAGLKQKTAIAEEQLNLMVLENTKK